MYCLHYSNILFQLTHQYSDVQMTERETQWKKKLLHNMNLIRKHTFNYKTSYRYYNLILLA